VISGTLQIFTVKSASTMQSFKRPLKLLETATALSSLRKRRSMLLAWHATRRKHQRTEIGAAADDGVAHVTS